MFFRKLIQCARPILIILAIAHTGSFVSAYVLPFTPYPKIEISGNNTLSLNLSKVEGSQSFYGDDNVGKDQVFSNSSNLYITGELYNDLFLNATVSADRYSPDSVRWNLRYDGNDAKVLLGEFNANLTGNEYVLLNRSLAGTQVDVKLPKGTLTMIGSSLEAPVRTDTIYGQNITGPYYLSSSPIVDGSEIVSVNNNRMTRTTDYTIDYTSGILNFTAGHIISPADKITVSYEASASGLGGGRLYAMRATYPIKDNLEVGVSQLMLDGRNRGSTQREDRDQFLGNGTPGPFYLRSRPIIALSETVTINGVLVPQVNDAGEHPYTLDYQTGSLLFNQNNIPPIGSTVIVRYKVEISGSGSGDRAVTGLDMNLALNNGLSLNMQAAQSSGDGESNGDNRAFTLGANYSNERMKASMQFRNVGSGFSPLEMVGYRNVDQEMLWSLSYSPSRDLTVSTTGNNTRLPLNPYLYGGQVANQLMVNERNRQFTVDYHRENWPQIVFQHNIQDTSQVDMSNLGNNTTTDSLRFILAREHLNGTLELNRVKTNSSQLTDVNNPDSLRFDYDGTTDNAALNLQYQPNDRFNMGLNLAANSIQATSTNGDTATSGNNAQVNASYRASDNLTFSTSLSANKTGATQNVTGTDIAALKDRNFNLSADWRARSNVNVNLSYNNTRTEGGDYSNSESDNLSTNVGWQVNSLFNLNAYWSRQNLKYMESPGGSVSNMVGMNTEIGPFGKVKLNLDAQHLWGETSYAVNQMLATQGDSRRTVRTQLANDYMTTATGNKLTTLAARVSYPIARKQEVFLTAETMQSSGFPSKSLKNSYGIGWNYHISENLTFTVDAGRVQYNDEANESLNYNANQFNAQLSWNF